MRSIAALTFFVGSLSMGFTQSDWIVKQHSGGGLNYRSTVGTMPISTRGDEVDGKMFFTSYQLDGGDMRRPVMFVFNGGPGSASLWLHLGFVGPKRPKMLDEAGMMPPPPYSLVENKETLLPSCDIVCIDPIGTGYSRATKAEYGPRFWGLNEDINSVGIFIRNYLTKNNRWLSPIYLMGESYGTTRAAGLSDWLTSNGIGVNGIVMVSTVLNFGASGFAKADLRGYAGFMPSFTATAWYHRKLDAGLQKLPVGAVVEECRKWVANRYLPTMIAGSSETSANRKQLAKEMARLTGIDQSVLEECNLRLTDRQFYEELLKSDRQIIGRLDGRFKGFNRAFTGRGPDFDPSEAAIRPPFTSCINDYLRRELGYETDLEYFALGGGIGNWNMDRGVTDVSERLRSAMTENPYMKVLFTNGYYDFATPFGAVEYTVNQMELDPRLMKNVAFTYYPSGHMIYLDDASRRSLRDDVVKFIKESH